jgi:glycerol-3-phosphate acyltransferase PlsY
VWSEFGGWLVAGYLLGSVPMAYLVVKLIWGKDLRDYGSRQVGGSNLFRSFSKPLAVLVGIFDASKGVLMVWTAHLLGLTLAMQIAVGAAVVIGHWPIFLKFNAGRGLATTVGICFYFIPWSILPFACIAAFTLLLGASPLPTLVGVASFPVTSAVLHKPLELTLGMAALLLIMIVRRLTAPMSERSQGVSRREMYFYRFFFDRDIKDGRAWTMERPAGPRPWDKGSKGMKP